MFFSFFHKLVGGVSDQILASVQLPKISLLFEMDILRPWLSLKAIRHLSSPGVPGRFGAHSNFYSVMIQIRSQLPVVVLVFVGSGGGGFNHVLVINCCFSGLLQR